MKGHWEDVRMRYRDPPKGEVTKNVLWKKATGNAGAEENESAVGNAGAEGSVAETVGGPLGEEGHAQTVPARLK